MFNLSFYPFLSISTTTFGPRRTDAFSAKWDLDVEDWCGTKLIMEMEAFMVAHTIISLPNVT